ncbi:MAG: exodeoxyribonuclease VII small subunit [Pirellulaceae bacterium]
MARKKSAAAPPSDEMSFEDAYSKLEGIVRQLEDGQLGLSDSLAQYEEGVKHLKHCHHALEHAERKIHLLTGVDEDGNPVTEPFEDTEQTLEEKQESRGRRRSRSAGGRSPAVNPPPESGDDADIDTQRGLF